MCLPIVNVSSEGLYLDDDKWYHMIKLLSLEGDECGLRKEYFFLSCTSRSYGAQCHNSDACAEVVSTKNRAVTIFGSKWRNVKSAQDDRHLIQMTVTDRTTWSGQNDGELLQVCQYLLQQFVASAAPLLERIRLYRILPKIIGAYGYNGLGDMDTGVPIDIVSSFLTNTAISVQRWSNLR